VTVKSGYGHNFLLPQRLSHACADKTNKKITAENVRQAAHKADKVKERRGPFTDSVGDMVPGHPAKIGESGRVQPGYHAATGYEALKAKGVDIDHKRLSFDQEPAAAGEFTATILAQEVKHTVKFRVVAE
jgi:large subunit ribosomal protein L9